MVPSFLGFPFVRLTLVPGVVAQLCLDAVLHAYLIADPALFAEDRAASPSFAASGASAAPPLVGLSLAQPGRVAALSARVEQEWIVGGQALTELHVVLVGLILVLKDAAEHNRRHEVLLAEVAHLPPRRFRLEYLRGVDMLKGILVLDKGRQVLFLLLVRVKASQLAC